MSYPHDHLLDKAFELLNAHNDDKIQYIQEDKWIGYPRAKDVLDILEDLLAYPKVARMPNLLIVGDTNNGKTQILRRFSKRYPVDIDEDTGTNLQPVVFISAPSRPDENEFFIRLLQYLFVPYSKTSSLGAKKEQVIRTLRQRKTKMLIIDEIQHVIAGSYNAQKTFLNSIKDLSNELMIPIVAAGIEDAFNAIQIDPQLANRFQVEVLGRWRYDTSEQKKLFKQLLKSIESRLPFEQPSYLYKSSFASQIHYLSEGLIGEAVMIIKKLAVYAIRSNAPCITEEMIKQLRILPPSKRKETLKRIR